MPQVISIPPSGVQYIGIYLMVISLFIPLPDSPAWRKFTRRAKVWDAFWTRQCTEISYKRVFFAVFWISLLTLAAFIAFVLYDFTVNF